MIIITPERLMKPSGVFSLFGANAFFVDTVDAEL